MKAKVAAMQRGEVPIYEPNLDTPFPSKHRGGTLGVHHGFAKSRGWQFSGFSCTSHPSG